MFENCKNTKKQGDLGLGSAISYFTSKGYTVCIPLTDSDDYDLVVDIDGLKKVQIKTTSHKPNYGIYVVGLKMCGGNAKSNFVHKFGNEIQYDLLFVLTEEGSKYLIPKDIIKDLKNSISLGKKYEEYKI